MPYVLIVDDDADVRQALVDGLVIAGACHVEPAGSAAEALASVERQILRRCFGRLHPLILQMTTKVMR